MMSTESWIFDHRPTDAIFPPDVLADSAGMEVALILTFRELNPPAICLLIVGWVETLPTLKESFSLSVRESNKNRSTPLHLCILRPF